MDFLHYLQNNKVYLDGGMGTLLQGAGLAPGECPERWNLTHAQTIVDVHRAYFDAGSHVVCANTFGANPLKFSEEELESVIKAAMQNAQKAKQCSTGAQPKWVALDIGPTGRLLAPLGDLDFEDAVAAFAQTVKLGVKYGAELILIETMNDSYETKAALLAAKENSTLPVLVSNAYGEDGKLMTGAEPEAMVAMLEGLGADAVGVNCSLGPLALFDVVKKYVDCACVPVLCKPNAGLPRVQDGRTVYDVPAQDFAQQVAGMVALGVRAVGGCCGTTPEYIAALTRATMNIQPPTLAPKSHCRISSYTHAVTFGQDVVLIGERINPTGKKAFKQALRKGDFDYILREGIAQQERGVHVLDVNVGLPEIDEAAVLQRAVCELQAVLDLPLQIDSSDPVAMERALRRYNGKAMINSVNGKAESMRSVFPLVKKYGGVVVALTLDEQGIPETAEGRVSIARRILDEAARYGVEKKDIIFDPLALTVSADQGAALQTLEALRLIKEELGCHTSLGVSNVSFGLPQRDTVNATFFALALQKGLSAAIMNPYSREMLSTYYAYRALCGKDACCADYIAYAQSLPQTLSSPAPVALEAPNHGGEKESLTPLQYAVYKGLRERAAELTDELLGSTAPLDIVQKEIVPALDRVGEGFENKTLFLPQLLMSAEAARAAFECIKQKMPAQSGTGRCAVVIATVQGDIHDIGKNIVKLLLENYGFSVVDLGRDVAPEAVAAAVLEHRAPLVALSALMTTTVPAMEQTVKQIRACAPLCRVMVGGAVLNAEYAQAIGADYYGKDAMEAVRYAEQVEKEYQAAKGGS